VFTPTFEVKSIVPALYSLDSSDPLEGKVPFIVVWKDTTSSQHPYMVPQKKILWCFGDSESGSSNYVTETNSTGKVVVASDQTHSFSDYERYTITGVDDIFQLIFHFRDNLI